MWDSKINDVIIEYFKENYARLQIEFYDIDVGNEIQGGVLGLKHLLNLPVEHTDVAEIYSPNPVATARRLADAYFTATDDILIYVRTIISNRELEIIRRGRKIATVYIESTASDTAVDKEIGGVVRRFVSPKLHIIALLEKIYAPQNYEDRPKNIELLRRIFGISSQYVKHQANDWSVLSSIVKDKVIVYASESQIIAISDRSPEDDARFLAKKSLSPPNVHGVRLPGEYLMQKVTAKIGKIKYTVYNSGMFELIPFYKMAIGDEQWKIAIPSVAARFLLIEDNTVYSLVKAGRLNYGRYLAAREHIEAVFSEEYPLEDFFGEYQDRGHLKKVLIKESAKYPMYFPYAAKVREITEAVENSEDIQRELETYLAEELKITYE